MRKSIGFKESRLLGADRMPGLHGQFWCEIYEKDSLGQRVLVETTPKRHNDIANKQKELTLGRLANEGAFTGGILYHAFGAGDASWDTLGDAAVDPTHTTLVSELTVGSRIVPDIINYLDAPGGSVLGSWVGATCIRIRTTIPFVSPMNGQTFREQGLFGGNATSAKDTGLIVDAFHHERRAKSLSNEFIYFIELYF